MSSSTTSSSACILDTSKDWDNWFSIIKVKAERASIWELIDPTVDTTPLLPSKPIWPTPSHVKQGATSALELDLAQRQELITLRSMYKTELFHYKETQLPSTQIGDYIASTVSLRNQVYIENCKTPN